MLYSILFAGLVYLNNARNLLQIDVTSFKCTASDDSTCTSGLVQLYGPGFLTGTDAEGQSFVCGINNGFCTITCTDGQSDCDAVNAAGLGITTSYCETDAQSVDVGKCVVDTSCQSSADCQDALLPLCVQGVCSPQTPSPTDVTPSPVTKTPTVTPDPNDPQATQTPTAKPTTCLESCANDAYDPMYCEGSEDVPVLGTITIDCTDARNECEAQCIADAKKAEILAPYSGTTLDAINDAIADMYPQGLVAEFCYSGSCSDDPGDEPTTTEDKCADPLWLNSDGCPVDPGSDGCGVQFNVTLDFCLMNNNMRLKQIMRYVKYAYKYALNTVSSYSGYCDAEGAIQVTRYKAGTTTANAALVGKKTPTKKRDGNEAECDAYSYNDWETDDCCEDLDALCGADRSSLQFQVEVDTAFNCGISPDNCDTMRSIALEVVEKLKDFDASFILECLDLSVEGDTVCADGFGGITMEIEKAVLAYVDADGNEEIIASTQGSNHASEVTYGFALIFACIMAAIY